MMRHHHHVIAAVIINRVILDNIRYYDIWKMVHWIETNSWQDLLAKVKTGAFFIVFIQRALNFIGILDVVKSFSLLGR